MQMYPGAGYKEQHHYKVEKEDYMYKDDFGLSKGSSSSMHTIKPNHGHQYATADHHHNYGRPGPNMHMMMKPTDHHRQHHNYGGGQYGQNRPGMNSYSETTYEHHNNNFSGNHHNYGRPSYGGPAGGGYADHHNYGMPNYGGNGAAVWDCKGMDD